MELLFDNHTQCFMYIIVLIIYLHQNMYRYTLDKEIEWVDESSVVVKYPILDAGDKGNVPLPDGGLKSLFQAVKDRKKMSVAFDIQDVLPEQVHSFMKSILDQIPGLPDGLIIVLHLLDGAMFQAAAECLQNTETCLTERMANGKSSYTGCHSCPKNLDLSPPSSYMTNKTKYVNITHCSIILVSGSSIIRLSMLKELKGIMFELKNGEYWEIF